MSASYCALLITLVHITKGREIFIENAGFEMDSIGFNNSYTYGAKVPSNWLNYDPNGIMKQWSLGIIVYRGGVAYNDSIFGDGSPEGVQLFYLDTSSLPTHSAFGVQQTLTGNVVEADTTYTLSVWVGNPASNTFSEHSRWGVEVYNETGFGGYGVQLAANDNILAQDNNTLLIPEGTWKQSVITTTISDTDVNIGQTLQIRLIHKNIGVTNDAPPYTVNFDDVQLKADPATHAPTNQPVLTPTNPPIVSTTKTPSVSPINPPVSPTDLPTSSPIKAPTDQPVLTPTNLPTHQQTQEPTQNPFVNPTINLSIMKNPTAETTIVTFITSYLNTSGHKHDDKILNTVFIASISSAVVICVIMMYLFRSKVFKVMSNIKKKSNRNDHEMHMRNIIEKAHQMTSNSVNEEGENTKTARAISLAANPAGEGRNRYSYNNQKCQCNECGVRVVMVQKEIKKEEVFVCETCQSLHEGDVDNEVDKMFDNNKTAEFVSPKGTDGNIGHNNIVNVKKMLCGSAIMTKGVDEESAYVVGVTEEGANARGPSDNASSIDGLWEQNVVTQD